MKRLLCIINSLEAGGAETMLMKLYREMDKEQVQFDLFIMIEGIAYYEPEIIRLGGKVHHNGYVSIVRKPLQALYLIYQCIKKNKYKYVLLSTEKAHYIPFLVMSKIAGAKVLALRSTNSTSTNGKFVDFIDHSCSFLVRSFTNVRLAPSELAADFMFGDKSVKKYNTHILNNGLKIEDYTYDLQYRNEIRDEFNFGNKVIIGSVARFYPQKNHRFLIDVFYEISKVEHEAVLLLIGQGILENEIRDKVKSLGLEDRVVFAGIRNDVRKCLMAMDVLVFPSLYEGMPNVVIEAQTTGLPCLVSDSVTSECKITDRVSFLSLENSPREWARTALEQCHKGERSRYALVMKEKGYDIQDVAKKFCRYMRFIS